MKYKDVTDYSCDYHAIWMKCFVFPFQVQVSSPKPIESKQGSILPPPFSLHTTVCPTDVEHLEKALGMRLWLPCHDSILHIQITRVPMGYNQAFPNYLLS